MPNTAMPKRHNRTSATEPAAAPSAADRMSAQLRSAGAPPHRVAQSQSVRRTPEPGEVAFDHWLRRELGRMYDATLNEPVPDELTKLLGDPAPKAPKKGE